MIRWYLELLHKPILLQTPLDRFWVSAVPGVATVLLIVLAAVVKVCVWDEWQQRQRR